MAGASFTGPGGSDPRAYIRHQMQALQTVTVGDLLYVGQIFRRNIRDRTIKQGVDVNGAPFAPYSSKRPYYLYPNREIGSTRGVSGTRFFSQSQINEARATAAQNRNAANRKKGDKTGVRTPYGIRYASYAAAKAAHGAANVNLFGMEQHTHMLDTMLVKAGGSQLDASLEGFDFGGDMAAFEQNQACHELTLGFYGTEAERAKGHNEGVAKTKLPKREFFALNQVDIRMAEIAIAERMVMRARAGVGASTGTNIGERVSGPVTDSDILF